MICGSAKQKMLVFIIGYKGKINYYYSQILNARDYEDQLNGLSIIINDCHLKAQILTRIMEIKLEK